MKRLNFERATTEMEANANCIGGFTFDFETLNLDKMTDNERLSIAEEALLELSDEALNFYEEHVQDIYLGQIREEIRRNKEIEDTIGDQNNGKD